MKSTSHGGHRLILSLQTLRCLPSKKLALLLVLAWSHTCIHDGKLSRYIQIHSVSCSRCAEDVDQQLSGFVKRATCGISAPKLAPPTSSPFCSRLQSVCTSSKRSYTVKGTASLLSYRQFGSFYATCCIYSASSMLLQCAITLASSSLSWYVLYLFSQVTSRLIPLDISALDKCRNVHGHGPIVFNFTEKARLLGVKAWRLLSTCSFSIFCESLRSF